MRPHGTGTLPDYHSRGSLSVSFPLCCFSSRHLKHDIYTCICLLPVSLTALQSPRGGHLFVLLIMLSLGLRTLPGSW